MTSVALVGSTGVGAFYRRRSTAEILAEYLARSSNVIHMFERAWQRIALQSCASTSHGHATSITDLGNIVLASTYGDWSIGLEQVVNRSDVISHVGYVLARSGNYFIIVSYENEGPLKVKMLEKYAALAMSKLERATQSG